MKYLYLLMFYTCISPFVFAHGIGLERLFILSNNNQPNFHFYAKNIIFALISSSISYFLLHFILHPLHLDFFFPIVLLSVLFFLEEGIFYLYENFICDSPTFAKNERIFSFGTVLLSLYEGSSFLEVLFLVLVSFLFMFVFSVLLRSIRKKIDTFNIENKWKALPLLLITLGIICTAFYFMDLFYI